MNLRRSEEASRDAERALAAKRQCAPAVASRSIALRFFSSPKYCSFYKNSCHLCCRLQPSIAPCASFSPRFEIEQAALEEKQKQAQEAIRLAGQREAERIQRVRVCGCLAFLCNSEIHLVSSHQQ